MSHEISQTEGVSFFADSKTDATGRVSAWHKLGTPIGHTATAEEALESAHLARWDVRKRPLRTILDPASDPYSSDLQIAVPGKYATVFTNPVDGKVYPLGVVGERYHPIQNEALATFANALVDEGGAHFETAGSLSGHSRVFLTMKLPRTFVLEGLDGTQDIAEWYLALFNSHDGTSGLFGITTNVRVVCANTAAAAIRGAHSKFTVRHTENFQSAVSKARESLGLAFEYEDAFEEEARALFETPFGDNEVDEFLKELLKLNSVEEGTAAATRRSNEMASIKKLWVSSPTIAGTPIAGTAYGAYNAVTEYVDHFQTTRATKLLEPDVLRANRTITQSALGVSLKHQAWDLLTTV